DEAVSYHRPQVVVAPIVNRLYRRLPVGISGSTHLACKTPTRRYASAISGILRHPSVTAADESHTPSNLATALPSLRDLIRNLTRVPSAEALGYSRSSLRDEGARFRLRGPAQSFEASGRADRPHIPPQPIAQEEFVSWEIRQVIALVQD